MIGDVSGLGLGRARMWVHANTPGEEGMEGGLR